MQTTLINAVYNRMLAAEPTLDLSTNSGRLKALGMLHSWISYTGECLAQFHVLRDAGDMRGAAKAYQQWFNLIIQINVVQSVISDEMQLTTIDQQAA